MSDEEASGPVVVAGGVRVDVGACGAEDKLPRYALHRRPCAPFFVPLGVHEVRHDAATQAVGEDVQQTLDRGDPAAGRDVVRIQGKALLRPELELRERTSVLFLSLPALPGGENEG